MPVSESSRLGVAALHLHKKQTQTMVQRAVPHEAHGAQASGRLAAHT